MAVGDEHEIDPVNRLAILGNRGIARDKWIDQDTLPRWRLDQGRRMSQPGDGHPSVSCHGYLLLPAGGAVGHLYN